VTTSRTAERKSDVSRDARGFTLIELLIVTAIVGVMLAGAVLNVNAGLKGARVRTAARTVHQLVRHARSMALLKQRSAVLTYETVTAESGTAGRITLELQGEGGAGDSEDEMTEEFMNPPPQDFEGVVIRAEKVAEDGEKEGEFRTSVFSNVDFLVGKKKEKVASTDEDGAEEDSAEEDELEEPVSVVFEPNGRCERHIVYVRPVGSDDENSFVVEVDPFGNPEVKDEP